MKMDKYNEIINGEETYNDIALALKSDTSIIIGWTDEDSMHYAILFSCNVKKIEKNLLQHGIRTNYLFVSIMGIGAFAFRQDVTNHGAGYVSEKLNVHGNNTTEKLAELINGVIEKL